MAGVAEEAEVATTSMRPRPSRPGKGRWRRRAVRPPWATSMRPRPSRPGKERKVGRAERKAEQLQ